MEKHILKYNGEEVDHLLAKIEQAPDAIASEAYVQTEVANLVNSAPETLDTLGEVAKAIEDNETVVDALNSAIGNKADTTYVNTELNKKANTSHTQAASTITAGTLATGMSCATPTANAHIANKSYVDSKVANIGGPKIIYSSASKQSPSSNAGTISYTVPFAAGKLYNVYISGYTATTETGLSFNNQTRAKYGILWNDGDTSDSIVYEDHTYGLLATTNNNSHTFTAHMLISILDVTRINLLIDFAGAGFSDGTGVSTPGKITGNLKMSALPTQFTVDVGNGDGYISNCVIEQLN